MCVIILSQFKLLSCVGSFPGVGAESLNAVCLCDGSVLWEDKPSCVIDYLSLLLLSIHILPVCFLRICSRRKMCIYYLHLNFGYNFIIGGIKIFHTSSVAHSYNFIIGGIKVFHTSSVALVE